MILTPIEPARLPALLERFAAGLDDARCRAVFARIARPQERERAVGKAARAHHAAALGLLTRLGMAVKPGSPREDFSWDGTAARADTEAYVLLHEGAHFQLAAPERRRLIDFGLGAGPETGAREVADRAATLFGLAREREEAMASLLGILWEVELGQPALASFLDQNWLEGAPGPGALAHFCTVLAALRVGGHIAGDGRPTQRLRSVRDDQVNALCGPALWM
jgi:hypothetical protein